jgi:hypothetical protein
MSISSASATETTRMRNAAEGLITMFEALSPAIADLQRRLHRLRVWQRVQTALLVLILVGLFAPYAALL